MIVKFPTGLYSSVLPQEPQDGGNVTFTISNNPPPRANLVFPKIPPGLVDRRKIPRDPKVLQRREVVGDLVFTINKSQRTQPGSNNSVFEVGQILEFSDAPLKSLDPMLVSPKTETQHNVFRVNYDPLEVSEEEQQLINDAALLTQQNLAEELNVIRQKRRDAEQIVVDNQKIINDANRTIQALTVIQDQTGTTDSDVDELIAKLEQKKDEAFIVRDQASEAANALAAEASRIQDELRTVSTVLT